MSQGVGSAKAKGPKPTKRRYPLRFIEGKLAATANVWFRLRPTSADARSGVPRVCLGQTEMRVGKHCKYLISKCSKQ